MPKKRKPKTLVEVFTEEANTPGTEAWFDMVTERYGPMLKLDGFDDCVIGVCHRFQESVLIYDREKIIDKLAKDMIEPGPVNTARERAEQAEQDAIEYFEFNIIGAWVGETTPCFLTKS